MACGPVLAQSEAQSYRDDLNAGVALEAKGDLRAAETRLRRGRSSHPQNPDLPLELARVYLKLGNSPAAEIEARNALRLGGDNDAVQQVRAQALLHQNKLSELINGILPASRDPKIEASIRATLGLAHLSIGDEAVGENLLSDAKRLDAGSPLSQLGIARLALLRGDIAGAERQLDVARVVDPDAIDVARLEIDLLRAKGDMAGALDHIGKILSRDPDDLGALSGRASILISQNKLDDAQLDIDHALEIAPQSITPNFLAAVILTRRNELQQANEILTQLSQYFPSLPNGYYLDGVVKYALGQNEMAIDDLTKFLARRPEHAGARRIVATVALKMGDPKLAAQVLKPLIDSDASDVQAVALLVQAYDKLGLHDELVDVLENAALAHPGDVRKQTQAAVVRIRYGDADAGMAELERIAATPTGVDIAGPILVLDQLHDGAVTKAAATVEALVAKNGDDVVIRNLLGGVRLAQLRLDDAEKIFRDIIAKDPEFLDARRNLARTYLAMGRPDAAKSIYLELLQKRPTDVETLTSLADSAAEDGQWDEAGARLQQAQDATPDDPSPGIRLVQLYAGQKQWDKALAAGHRLDAHFGADPHVVDLIATVLADSGDTTGAAAKYQPLTWQFPKSAEILLRYSSFQFRAGDKAGARESVEKALGIAPADANAMTALVELDFAIGGFDTALATARHFAGISPEASNLLSANLLVRVKRSDEAIAVLKESQRLYPSEQAVRRLAQLTYDAGDRPTAEGLLQDWLAKHDDAVQARLALANMRMLDHDYDAAQALYERSIVDLPQDAIALNNLAAILSDKGDPRAREFALRALRAAPSDQIADTVGWVLMKGGDAKTGLLYIRRAATGLPGDMTVQYHLAAALQATGAHDDARKLLESVMNTGAAFDGKDDAQRLLQQLRGG